MINPTEMTEPVQDKTNDEAILKEEGLGKALIYHPNLGAS